MRVSDFISDDTVKIDGKWYLIVVDAIDCEQTVLTNGVYILRKIGYNSVTKHLYLQNNAWVMSVDTAESTEVEDSSRSQFVTPELDNYGEEYEPIRKDVMLRR